MQIKHIFNKEERAVSPVIGVILMVAITVILAAVIGTFVLGLGSNIQKEVNAGATVDFQKEADTGSVTVTWTSQGTAETLVVSVSGDTTGLTSSSATTLTGVGQTATYEESGTADTGDSDLRVVVKAVGEDGTETVVLTKEITI